VLDQVGYSWRCTLCDAFGFGGGLAFVRHYQNKHQSVATAEIAEAVVEAVRSAQAAKTNAYTGFLIEAREEHGLKGAAAYEWAHSAYVEYCRNQ